VESAFRYATLSFMQSARASAVDSSNPWSGHFGLCSVTLRTLAWRDVVNLAVEAGLSVIEWGADFHAPADKLEQLTEIRKKCAEVNLRIGSYGSYWRAGESSDADGEQILRGAVLLGAPRVRIWAGVRGSRDVKDHERLEIIRQTQRLADIARVDDIELAFEYHANTLTDSAQSALKLIQEVDRENVHLYWQPPNNMSDDKVLESLTEVLQHICAIHVFSWWPDQVRLPLNKRGDMWISILSRLANANKMIDLLLEFVPDDNPQLIKSESAYLQFIGRKTLE